MNTLELEPKDVIHWKVTPKGATGLWGDLTYSIKQKPIWGYQLTVTQGYEPAGQLLRISGTKPLIDLVAEAEQFHFEYLQKLTGEKS